MKKIYETPSAELCRMGAREDLLTEPSVSDTGYGWDDNGPAAVEPVN